MKINNIKDNILNEYKVKEFNASEMYKYFFNKPLTNYNPYIYEMFNYDNLLFDKEFLCENKGKWNKYFDNSNEISIEIGSGSGNFLNTLALKNKDINYIGFEIRFKRLVYSAKKSIEKSLNNICFVRYPNIYELDNIFGENEISNFYMNFPEPWDNKPSKRLFNEKLLEILDKILKNKGKIFFKTDHKDYYENILEIVSKNSNFRIIYKTDDLYNSDKISDNILTEFEQLFIYKLKETIKYIEIEKI